MDEEMNKIKNTVKKVLVGFAKKAFLVLLPIILIIIFLSSSVYYMNVWADGKGDDDWSGTPYAAGQYTSNVTLSNTGELKSSMSAQALWDKMIENGSRVNLYLDKPEELLKLMNAEIITQFPDVREDPTQPIKWESIYNNITEESTLQGIIKFKRESDGSEPYIMRYAEPYMFDGWLEDYKTTGNEESKKNALSHFTIREEINSTASSSNGTSIVTGGKVADVSNVIVNEIKKMNTYGLTGNVCQTWVGKAYQAAGFGYTASGCCAYLAGTKWGISKDFSQIVSGAAVWTGDGSYRGSKTCEHAGLGGCGHAGIYYKDESGNDWVMNLVNGRVKKDTLQHWLEYYGKGNTPVWGWQGGLAVEMEDGDTTTSTTTDSETEQGTDTATTENVASNSKYYVEVATWTETTEEVKNVNVDNKKPKSDPDVEQYKHTTYNMNTTKINYQQLVSNYTMPFDYLWSMLVITEDKDFVMELADLVYNSQIEITVFDNLTTNTNVNEYTYTKNKKTETEAKVTATGSKRYNKSTKTVELPMKGTWTGAKADIEPFNFKTTHTTITKVNTLNVDITYADVWMAKYEQDYKYPEIPENIVTTSGGALEDMGYPDTPSATGENDTYGHARELLKIAKEKLKEEHSIGSVSGHIDYIKEKIYYSTINRNEAIKNTVESSKYVETPLVVTPKTDKESEEPNFVTIFLDPDNLKAKNNILSVESWLFELLEIHDSTVDLVDLTKYLLYMATGTDYGVTEFNFNIFDSSKFIGVGSAESITDLLKEYIHHWEHSTEPPKSADGTKYIIEDDGAGHPTAGYGVDIFNGGFAEEFKQAGYPTHIGGEVPIEFVDALEEREIQENLEYVKSVTDGLDLKEYQIIALVSRLYNCGKAGGMATKRGSPSMNFVDSYKAYWKDTDNLFESKNSNANFSHALYTNYMSKPVTSNGKYMRGLERRRKSEWTLFQTGYFDVLDKWYSEEMLLGGTILECAKTIHEYMESNSYTYCVYGGNSNEECSSYGKTHGLSKTFEESKSNKNACCATYVSWVLQEAGYLTDDEHLDGANDLTNLLINKGWKVITNPSEFLPGDVLTYNKHVEIYAGDGKIYNAGSGKSIRGASPSKMYRTCIKALRAPN